MAMLVYQRVSDFLSDLSYHIPLIYEVYGSYGFCSLETLRPGLPIFFATGTTRRSTSQWESGCDGAIGMVP